MHRDHHFDPYDAFTQYVNAARHRHPDGRVKSIATMAKELECDPSVLPAEGYIKSATGATWEELYGLPPLADDTGRPKALHTL